MDTHVHNPSNPTKVERKGDREVVITRSFAGPARLVFDAWTKPELIKRWWTPKSFGITFLSCEMDVRTGGSYRFVFSHASSKDPLAFFGKYLDVVPNARLVWTNDESGEDSQVTTVTFEEQGGQTLVRVHELYSSAEALEAGIGATEGAGEQYAQLDEVLAALSAGA